MKTYLLVCLVCYWFVTNTFPFASQEFPLVGDTTNVCYPSFDISHTLHAHINLDTAHQQEEANVVEYNGPTLIVNPLSNAMQTYHYVNQTKDKEVNGYLPLYHVKQQIDKAIPECVDLEWATLPSILQDRHWGESSLHKKSPQHPEPREWSTHWTLDYVHSLRSTESDTRTARAGGLGGPQFTRLINWVTMPQWNHNRDSAHILHNIFEFQIHIYSVNAIKAGSGWSLSQSGSRRLKQ